MTDGRELMRLHAEALFAHDARGQLVRVNVPGGGPAPRFFLGRTADGAVWRVRHDVDDDTRTALAAAAGDGPFRGHPPDAPIDPSPYEEILARVAPVERTWVGPAFHFPRDLPAADGAVPVTAERAPLLDPLLHAWVPDVPTCQPMFVLVVDGRAVSVCATVRRTDAACEAGVETAPDYRGRGYAARVVAPWARAVRAEGRVPLYSTSWRNEASRAVARRLALVLFGSDLHVT